MDKNFMVVTVVLGGLLVWSLTQRPEQKDPTQYILPPPPPPSAPEYMEWEEPPTREDGAFNIMQWLQRKATDLVNARREIDNIFLDEENPARSLNELQGKAKWQYQKFMDLYRACMHYRDVFKEAVAVLDQEFGESEWIQTYASILNIPQETLTTLDGYKKGAVYYQTLKQYNQMNVYDDFNVPEGVYARADPNRQANMDADDAFKVHKRPQKPGSNVFMDIAGADDVTMSSAADMLGSTTTNPVAVGGGAHQTHTNDDAFDTLNPGGALGSGGLGERASPMDIREQDTNAKAAAKDKDPGAGGFNKAAVTSNKPSMPEHPFHQAPNDQTIANAKKIDDLVKQQTEMAKQLAAQKAKDGNQDVSAAESGVVPAGMPAVATVEVEDGTVIPPEFGNEKDAAPVKPKPKVVPPASVPSLSQPKQLPKPSKRDRDADPYVALQGGPAPKKAKPSPEEKKEEPAQEPAQETEELDLTGGTKRGGDDPILTPESRGDIKTSDKNKPKRPYTEGVTNDPLLGAE